MKTEQNKRMELQNNSTVLIAGGGPSGSFAAIHLLEEAKKAHIHLNVTIIDRNAVRDPLTGKWKLKGCSGCAGIISPRLDRLLLKTGIDLPRSISCHRFTHVWLHGTWKNFPFRIPPQDRMYAVFRRSLPQGNETAGGGFDSFLLRTAADRGSSILTGEVVRIGYKSSMKPVLSVITEKNKTLTLEADFVCAAAGIQSVFSGSAPGMSFAEALHSANPAFVPPVTRRAMVFEMHPGKRYIEKHMNRELFFIVTGSKQMPLDHITLVPKGEYLTAALVGEQIDRAVFPEDTRRIISEFFLLPQVRALLPGLTRDNTPVTCTCTPSLVIRPSLEPVCDRIAPAGDLLGSRLYRDGLTSAFVSAKVLARTAVSRGIDKNSLSMGYRPVMNRLERDSRAARKVLRLVRIFLKSPILSRILYQSFASEMKFRKRKDWHLGNVLWLFASGSAGYDRVLQKLRQPPVIASLTRGTARTIRNILTERFFGIRWGEFGRYPTVVVREKREAIKQAIENSLSLTLDTAPQVERMYVIKIRAPAGIIFEELGRFGDEDSHFLKLRFLDVNRVAGEPNRTGATIRYRLKWTGPCMDIDLTRSVPDRALFYRPSELFCKNGKLIFDIASTKDGNQRLVIYTAFDFKKSDSCCINLFWKMFKALFPDFAHDVVWNHALCTIKHQAEKRAGANRQGISCGP